MVPPEATIGRRKKIEEKPYDEEDEHEDFNDELVNAMEQFKKLCNKLKKEGPESLLLFQNFCNEQIDLTLQNHVESLVEQENALEREFGSEEEEDDHEENDEDDEQAEPSNEIQSHLNVLNSIKSRLRSKLPLNAYAPNEQFYFPGEIEEATELENRQFDNYQKYNTIHVDSFLYDNDEMNDLFDTGKLKKYYCDKCCSNDHLKEVNIISHSFSLEELAFIFSGQCVNKDAWIRKRVLEKIKTSLGIPATLSDKEDYKLLSKRNMQQNGLVIVDVGSRLGSILYYAYLFCDPNAIKKLVGVEINSHFAKMQNEIIRDFRLGDRIEIRSADVMTQKDLIQNSDLLIMHNVFEWFFTHKENQNIWKRLREEFLTRPGLRLVTCPSIQQSLEDAGLKDVLSIDGWLREIPLRYPYDDDNELMFTEMHLYEVI